MERGYIWKRDIHGEALYIKRKYIQIKNSLERKNIYEEEKYE